MPDPPKFTITKVDTPTDIQSIITLFENYATSLGIDLTFQDFATEMAGMPGKYAPPTGVLLLAHSTANSEPIGCVGLRPLPSSDQSSRPICEMKRLYVTSSGRGTGLGRALALRVIAEAKELGYGAIRLDTLQTMDAARALYKGLGFVEIGAYYDTPLIDSTVFLELDLTNDS